jgi:hypothetical protein
VLAGWAKRCGAECAKEWNETVGKALGLKAPTPDVPVQAHRRHPVEQVMNGVRRFTLWGLWFGGALILLAAALIGIDVLMRKFLNRSIGGADELAGYALAIGTAWGLGAALIDRAHIRIDSLYVLFPRKLRLLLDLAALSCSFVLRTDDLARARRDVAVVDRGLAQPVGDRGADRDPAGALDRRPARLRCRGRPPPACTRA